MKTIRCEAIFEGGRVVLLARLEKADATAAQQADVYSVSIKVYDTGDPANAVVSETPAVSTVIYNSTAVTNGWTIDSAQRPDPVSGLYGWNFRYVCPNTFFPRGDRTYAVEAEVVAVAVPQDDTAAKDYQRWDVPTINLLRR